MKEAMRSATPPAIPYDYAEQVGHLLRRAYQRNLAIFQCHCTDASLTSVQFVALCVLVKHGPQSQAALGRLAAIDPSTMKGVINRLQDRALIALAPARGDKRKTMVHLTKAGQALYDEMSGPGLNISELTLAPLNSAERVALVYVLRKISDFEPS